LANGQELKSAAEELGITYGTARSRLAQIFQKTETRRQGELIRLLVMYLL
jgi:DNA-binding CsgD family transcriptional regulator